MKQASRIPPVLIALGRLAVLAQVAYLCAYVGWRCVDDRLYSVAKPDQGLHQLADRVFAPIQNLSVHIFAVGSDATDAQSQSIEEQTRKARMILERMGHRTR